MLIGEAITAGAIPALEMTIRFAGQRQRVLTHNIANLSTPNFQPKDASISGFQRTLRDAIDSRREQNAGAFGPLRWRETRELKRDAAGELRVEPTTHGSGILFHDRNNRNLERHMQDLAENLGVFRVAGELLKSRYDLLRSAMSERV